MRAITVKMPDAHLIAEAIKTVETRQWATKYRGPLLICAGKQVSDRIVYVPDGVMVTPYRHEDLGHAICTIDLLNCTAMAEEHEAAALVRCRPGLFAWTLGNVRKVEPFPVVGKLGFFEVDYD